MTLDGQWFSEAVNGSAISLAIREKLHEERSPFQLIEVYETVSYGRLLTLDGLTMLTGCDNFIYHEMLAHMAMFSHPDPRRVAIVGGGDCGTLAQVLQHPDVEAVWQVELDERVTRVSEQYFPELCDQNNHPSAHLLFEDGIEWMAQRESASVDVIILDTTDPVGQAARLFSEDFYRECYRVLDAKGVLIAQSESPLFNADLIVNIGMRLLAAGFSTTAVHPFPLSTYPSGWWSATLACKQAESGFRQQAARQKTFKTRYYNAALHLGSRALPEFLNEALALAGSDST